MSSSLAVMGATASPALASSPFVLGNLDAWRRWREQKLARYPGSEAARTADDRLRAIQLSRAR